MLTRDPASYRDPAGYIISNEDTIYRVITSTGAQQYLATRNTPVIQALIARKWLLPETQVPLTLLESPIQDACYLLSHPKLSFISYPYEWPFSALQQAALRHLQIQKLALRYDITLTDASAFNVQFIGANPIFIDHLSFKSYQPGEYWLAHKQFCEEFLNPLLLKAYNRIDYQPLYRGTNRGITTQTINRLLPLRKKISVKGLMHVTLPAYYERKAKQTAKETMAKKPLSKQAYLTLLTTLEQWISALKPQSHDQTYWQHYANDNHYQAPAIQAKQDFVRKFIHATRPTQLWDLGCNSGDYAMLALAAGAQQVIGFDSDLGALDVAYGRALQQQANFTPLYLDLTNPSPAQGWAGLERKALNQRGNPDALLALALVHHLALGSNVPLQDVIGFLLQLAPTGVIEFIPKQDPMIQQMLLLKGDLFPEYCFEKFEQLITAKARIINMQQITEHGRVLIWYEQ